MSKIITECIVCGKPAHTSMSGALLCPEHHGDAQCWAEDRHARGLPASVVKWAASRRADARQATTIRLTPSALAEADALAGARGISRNELIEQLILSAQPSGPNPKGSSR
jgi:hypothetical protein